MKRELFVPDEPVGERRADPVSALYSRADVARIFSLDPARLRAWERSGLARPSAEQGEKRMYTFQDLVSVRTTKGLVDRGIPVAKIRRALDALRKSIPGTAPITELRIVSDGKTLAVRKGGTTFDPLTGQLLLDFDVGTLRDDVVRALPVTSRRDDARTAYDYFLDGCRLDDDESSRSGAESAYRNAIRLDPSLASAYTNLGNLRLMAHDLPEAEALYRRAMAIDAAQTEAIYNLGLIHLDRGAHEEAISLFARATELDADFADAHFNLATALERAQRSSDALPHWIAYLSLAPDGPYAPIARERVPRRSQR